MMTTSSLRASNLTLLAAFPSAQAPTFERCGQGCAAHSSSSRLVTCGHMYLDQGWCSDFSAGLQFFKSLIPVQPWRHEMGLTLRKDNISALHCR